MIERITKYASNLYHKPLRNIGYLALMSSLVGIGGCSDSQPGNEMHSGDSNKTPPSVIEELLLDEGEDMLREGEDMLDEGEDMLREYHNN